MTQSITRNQPTSPLKAHEVLRQVLMDLCERRRLDNVELMDRVQFHFESRGHLESTRDPIAMYVYFYRMISRYIEWIRRRHMRAQSHRAEAQFLEMLSKNISESALNYFVDSFEGTTQEKLCFLLWSEGLTCDGMSRMLRETMEESESRVLELRMKLKGLVTHRSQK